MLNVDRVRRTIDGRAAPFDTVGRARLELPRRFPFGSLAWDEWPPLLLEHNHSLRVGKVTAFHATYSFGLWVNLQVSRGPKGDRALELAMTTHRGLSMGLDPSDIEYRIADDGVQELVHGRIIEVTLTADPVFK